MIGKYQVNNRYRTIFFISIICLISFLIMLRQFLTAGYFSCLTGDTFAYTSWASQFIDALKEGIIYPRWTSLNFWGYGSPTFILYPPLAYYLTALFNVFTGSVTVAMKIVKYTALLLSGIGLFFLVREFYSEQTALLSSIFYMGFPFNVFGLYYYGTFASVVSLIWFSPIMLFTYKSIKSRQGKYVLYAGVCYGGLILTHLINAYMFSFVMAGFVVCLSLIYKRPKDIVVLLFIILIGCAISASYLFPLLYEKQFINLKAFIAGKNFFNYSQFFIFPNMTKQFPPGYFWPDYYMDFLSAVFLLSVFICIFLLHMMKTRNIITMRNVYNVNMFFLGTALCTIFLLFGVSSFLWNAIPFFKFIQFPFRWMNITVLAVAFLSAASFGIMEHNFRKRAERFTTIAIVCLIFFICILYDYEDIMHAHLFPPEELTPIKSVYWTEEHLPAGVDINKIRTDKALGQITIARGEGKAEVIAWKTANRVIKTTVNDQSLMKIKTFYYPGWKAFIDGKQIAINREDGTGAMLVDIPNGEHLLELKFVDTPIRYYSMFVTIFSLVLVIILIGVFQIRKAVV